MKPLVVSVTPVVTPVVTPWCVHLGMRSNYFVALKKSSMAFPLLGRVDFSTWTVGELATSSRGQKSAPVFGDSKPCPHLQLCTTQSPMHCPFGASAYNDPEATRLNMELDLSDQQCDQLGKLDEWARARAKDLGLRGEGRARENS